MFVRLALAAVAIAIVVVLVGARRDYDACQDARRTVIGSAFGRLPADREGPAIEAVRTRCRGADQLVNVAGALYQQHKLRDAMRVAQEAVDKEPQNALAWRALSASAATIDPAIARRAAARQLELSPLDPPPVDPAGGP